MAKVKPVIPEWRIGTTQSIILFSISVFFFMATILLLIFNTTKDNVSLLYLYVAILSFIAYIFLFATHYNTRWLVGTILVGGLLLLHIFYLYKVLNYMNYI